MWDVSEGLGESFADVEQYLGRCLQQKRNKNAEKQKNEKLSGQNASVRRNRKIMDLEVFDDE